MSQDYIESDLEFAIKLQQDEFMANDSLLALQLQNQYDEEFHLREPQRERDRQRPDEHLQRYLGTRDAFGQELHLLRSNFQRRFRGRGYAVEPRRTRSLMSPDSDSSGFVVNRNWTSDEDDGGQNYEVFLELGEILGDVAPKGLDSHEIDVLPTSTFSNKSGSSASAGHASSNDRSCHICLSEYEENENIRTLPCLHRFHTDCIDHWIKTNGVCPVCRAKIKDQLKNNQ